MKNVWAIGAHFDDIEIGCGGTLAKLSSLGVSVYTSVLTDSSYTFNEMSRKSLDAQDEMSKAMDALSLNKHIPALIVSPDNKVPHYVSNGELKYCASMMRGFEQIIKDKQIDTLFCHWRGDMNTDHAEAAKICITAGRHVSTILQFRSNWYQPDRAFNGIVYSDISGEPFERKKKALNCYQTEIKNRGQDWIDSFIKRDEINGLAIGKQAAEVFEPVRVLL